MSESCAPREPLNLADDGHWLRAAAACRIGVDVGRPSPAHGSLLAKLELLRSGSSVLRIDTGNPFFQRDFSLCDFRSELLLANLRQQ
jgi:hypothetical protein